MFRLMNELSGTFKSEPCVRGLFDVKLVNTSNIYEWIVYLRGVDPQSQLYESLQKSKETNRQDCIILNFEFSDNFPFSPPFVRVISPIIHGGHVQVRFTNVSTNNARKTFLFSIAFLTVENNTKLTK